MIYICIIILATVLDLATKYIIRTRVGINQGVPVIDNFVYIHHYENTGIAWSMLKNRTRIIVPMTILSNVFVGYFLYKTENMGLKVSLSFALGGALGNLADRLYKGSVTDFLQICIGRYASPVFNIADFFIATGMLLFMVFIFVHG